MKRVVKVSRDVLDDTDKTILRILSNDCRTSLAEIGTKVYMSRVAVRYRIKLMEGIGIITGYTAQIDTDKLAEHLEEGESWENILKNS